MGIVTGNSASAISNTSSLPLPSVISLKQGSKEIRSSLKKLWGFLTTYRVQFRSLCLHKGPCTTFLLTFIASSFTTSSSPCSPWATLLCLNGSCTLNFLQSPLHVVLSPPFSLRKLLFILQGPAQLLPLLSSFSQALHHLFLLHL